MYCHASSVLMACVCVCVCREKERREKVEEARRETERILAEQEAEVARRKVSNCASTSNPPMPGLVEGQQHGRAARRDSASR